MAELRRPVIQSFLFGFLELLGLKNGGANPESIAPYVQPVFELQDWYIRAKRINQSFSLAFPTGTVSTDIATVPAGEWWHIERFTVSAALVAADVARQVVGRHLTSTGGFAVTERANNIGSVAADSLFCPEIREFWLGPGDKLNIFTQATIAGASTLQGQYLFTKVFV